MTTKENELEKLRQARDYYRKTCDSYLCAPADGKALDHAYMTDARRAYTEACIKFVEHYVLDSESTD
jgi:hypothetical protein